MERNNFLFPKSFIRLQFTTKQMNLITTLLFAPATIVLMVLIAALVGGLCWFGWRLWDIIKSMKNLD